MTVNTRFFSLSPFRGLPLKTILQNICQNHGKAMQLPNPYLGGRPALIEKTDPRSLYAGLGSPVVPNRIPLELS